MAVQLLDEFRMLERSISHAVNWNLYTKLEIDEKITEMISMAHKLRNANAMTESISDAFDVMAFKLLQEQNFVTLVQRQRLLDNCDLFGIDQNEQHFLRQRSEPLLSIQLAKIAVVKFMQSGGPKRATPNWLPYKTVSEMQNIYPEGIVGNFFVELKPTNNNTQVSVYVIDGLRIHNVNRVFSCTMHCNLPNCELQDYKDCHARHYEGSEDTAPIVRAVKMRQGIHNLRDAQHAYKPENYVNATSTMIENMMSKKSDADEL